MKQTIKRLKAEKGDEGFTLIELLIVIVILGILAAIVVFAVGGVTDKGKKAACKSDFKTFQVAIEASYAQSNPTAYPAQLADVVPGFMRQPDSGTLAGNTYVVTGGYTFTYTPTAVVGPPAIAAGTLAVTAPALGCGAVV
jgi:prepilin-type N-terminal cleavage/methylation domain-containing protein